MIRAPERSFVVELGRACGGALLFAIPMLMTMEMWALGFYVEPLRLIVLLLATPLLLIGLAHYAGFRESSRLLDHLADAFVAIGVSAVGAGLLLAVFGVIGPGDGAREVVGTIGLELVPASFGAMLARGQFGQTGDRSLSRRTLRPHYFGELFIMAPGALFVALNVAPTEEVVDIAYVMTPWHGLALLFLSLLVMHAFVYFVEFGGRVPITPGAAPWGLFARFTLVGYVIVLLVSLGLLWVFKRLDGLTPGEVLSAAIVLSFPGAIGAAAARLVL